MSESSNAIRKIANEPDEPSTGAVSPKLILVVDDDADTRDIMQSLLLREGFAVNVASNGADAIVSLCAHRPYALVSDLMMPGGTGHEVVAFVRQSQALRGLPIAIVSGHPHLAPSTCAVFAKPLQFKRLLKFLRAP